MPQATGGEFARESSRSPAARADRHPTQLKASGKDTHRRGSFPRSIAEISSPFRSLFSPPRSVPARTIRQMLRFCPCQRDTERRWLVRVGIDAPRPDSCLNASSQRRDAECPTRTFDLRLEGVTCRTTRRDHRLLVRDVRVPEVEESPGSLICPVHQRHAWPGMWRSCGPRYPRGNRWAMRHQDGRRRCAARNVGRHGRRCGDTDSCRCTRPATRR